MQFGILLSRTKRFLLETLSASLLAALGLRLISMDTTKTTPPSYETQAKAFIDAYLFERKAHIGEEDNEILREIYSRASEARQDFKASVRSKSKPSSSHANNSARYQLSDDHMYQRRLVNNRFSAKASEVFRKVLKRRMEHELTRLYAQTKRKESEIQLRQSIILSIKREQDEIRARMVELNTALRKQEDGLPQISDVCVPCDELEGAGNCEFSSRAPSRLELQSLTPTSVSKVPFQASNSISRPFPGVSFARPRSVRKLSVSSIDYHQSTSLDSISTSKER